MRPRSDTARPETLRLSRLGLLALALPVGILGEADAQAGACTHARKGEPLKVHLLTTSPGDQVFNSMGHTAISLSGGPLEEPEVYNWGAFDGRRPDLLAAFLSGRMEFWLANEVWKVQWKRTVRQDRTMVAQELNLPQVRAMELLDSLAEGHKKENRYYIYNWSTNNCATRARDVLDEVTAGALKEAMDRPVDETARFEGARHLAPWPAVAFGFNFLASDYLDQPLTAWDVGMVPERLMKSVSAVEFSSGWPDGKSRPLVAETCTLRSGGNLWADPEPLPRWPFVLTGLLMALVGGGLTTRSAPNARIGGGVLLALNLAFGALLGTATLVLWANSDLNGVGPTENWAFAGPQGFVLVWMLVRALRGRASAALAWGAAAIAASSVVYAVLKLVLGLPQQNWDMVGTFVPSVLAVAAVVFHAARARPSSTST